MNDLGFVFVLEGVCVKSELGIDLSDHELSGGTKLLCSMGLAMSV